MDERLRALGGKEFDIAAYLDTPDRIAAFLSDALAEGDETYLTHALRLAARARAMHGLTPQSGDHPARDPSEIWRTLETIRSEMSALGMKLQVAAV